MKNSKLLIFVFGFFFGSLFSTILACHYMSQIKRDADAHMKLAHKTHVELTNMLIQQKLKVNIPAIKKKSK